MIKNEKLRNSEVISIKGRKIRNKINLEDENLSSELLFKVKKTIDKEIFNKLRESKAFR